MREAWSQLPNVLAALRLALAPLVALTILLERPGRALILLTVAGLTDYFDGWLARRYQWQSRLGALLDPAADKVLMLASYGALAGVSALPSWLFFLVAGRDVAIVVGAALVYAITRETSFPPSSLGKLSTTVQIAAGLAAIIRLAQPKFVPPAALEWAVNAAAGITALSGLHYVWLGFRRVVDSRPAGSRK